MIRIKGSGQTIRCEPIAFADLYLERTREASAQFFWRREMTYDGRKLRICRDLVLPTGTTYTTATISSAFSAIASFILLTDRSRPAPAPGRASCSPLVC